MSLSGENVAKLAGFEVAGVRVSAINLDDAVHQIDDWVRNKRRDFIVLTGAHGIVEMQSDHAVKEINNSAGMVTPDGAPLVWLGRALGYRSMSKVYAPTLMLQTFELPGVRHFFYGGAEGIAEQLSEAMRQQFPDLQVVGTYTPPFRTLTPDEVFGVRGAINAASPDIVWVGLGCPKQERWMGQFRPLLDAPLLIGVGAGFDFLSGNKNWAPRWVQYSGLEWLYRTIQEPRRLGRRYARVVPYFMWLAVGELFCRATGRARQ